MEVLKLALSTDFRFKNVIINLVSPTCWPPCSADDADLRLLREIKRGRNMRNLKITVPLERQHKTVDFNLKHHPCPVGCSGNRNTYTPTLRAPSSLRNPIIIPQSGRNRPKCHARTKKLAAPSRRHCVDTWRNRQDVLPEFMVERLQQQAMDEMPGADITGAINCFNVKRPTPSRSGKKCPIKINFREREKIKLMCANFAKGIVLNLLEPVNTSSLSPKVKALSEVVKYNIGKVMYVHKTGCHCNNSRNEEILQEVSEQIAVWMTTIIDESKYKLIEDELKDLELKEGPALDFLDLLFENVLDICQPNQPGEFSDGKYESLSEGLETDASEEPEFQQSESGQDKTGGTEINQIHDSKLLENNIPIKTDRIEEALKVPEEIIDTYKSHYDDHYFDKPEHTVNGQAENDKTFNETKAEIKPLNLSKEFKNLSKYLPKQSWLSHDSPNNSQDKTKELPEPIGVSQNKPKEGPNENDDLLNPEPNLLHDEGIKEATSIESFKETISVPETKINNLDDNLENNEDVSTMHKTKVIDEKFTTVSSEHINKNNSEDINEKKVKFISEDIGKGKLDISISSHINLSVIKFSSPKNNLLSDADESWPSNIALGAKVTAGISKSVESLGRLMETDEKRHTESDTNDISKDSDKKYIEDNQIVLSGSKEVISETEIFTKDLVYKISKTDVVSLKDDVMQKTSLLNIEKLPPGVVNVNVSDDRSVNNNLIHVNSSINKNIDLQNWEYTSVNPKIKVLKVDEQLTLKCDCKGENNKLLNNSRHCHGAPVPRCIPGSTAINGQKNQYLFGKSSVCSINSKQSTESFKVIEDTLKFDYRVNPETAPHWAKNEGAASYCQPTKINQVYSKKLCKRLLKTIATMERWSNWIDTACDNITMLKQINGYEKSKGSKNIPKNFVTLQESIDGDALLWSNWHKKSTSRLIHCRQTLMS